MRQTNLIKENKLMKSEEQILKILKVKKQEAHGPHRSPEKTVQINKHI